MVRSFEGMGEWDWGIIDTPWMGGWMDGWNRLHFPKENLHRAGASARQFKRMFQSLR